MVSREEFLVCELRRHPHYSARWFEVFGAVVEARFDAVVGAVDQRGPCAFRARNLTLKFVRQPHVVCIAKRQVAPFCGHDPGVARCCGATASRPSFEPHSVIGLGKAFDNRRGVVARAIVNDHKLQIGYRLA